MSFNEQYFDKALSLLEQRRTINKTRTQMRHDEVRAKLPEYAEMETILSDTSRRLISIMVEKKENSAEQLAQLEQCNLEIQQKMTAILQKGGFPDDYLEPVVSCKLCGDKGSVNGKWCECFQRLMLNAAAEELNSVSPLKVSDFDSFRTELYSEEIDPVLGTSPRSIMKRNFDFCRSYAEQFTTKSCGILMTGATGLGKTHLSLAIADAVIKKGYNVIYGSAPEILRILDREYFGKSNEDTMQSLTNCDLLILDDLGAEMEKSLYTSLLYELINSRINRELPTIINTNMGANDIKQRYQDRIWSRLFSFEVLMFVGTDVRRRLNKA